MDGHRGARRRIRALSSAGQSTGLLIRRSSVRIAQGAPAKHEASGHVRSLASSCVRVRLGRAAIPRSSRARWGFSPPYVSLSARISARFVQTCGNVRLACSKRAHLYGKARISARMDQTCRRTATISVRLYHSCRYVRSQARPRGPAQETPASHKKAARIRGSIRAASQDVGEGPRAEARRSARRSWPHPCGSGRRSTRT